MCSCARHIRTGSKYWVRPFRALPPSQGSRWSKWHPVSKQQQRAPPLTFSCFSAKPRVPAAAFTHVSFFFFISCISCCISHSWWHGQFQDTFFLLSYTTTNKETQHSILSSFLPPWIFSNFVLGNRPSSVRAPAHPAVLPDRTQLLGPMRLATPSISLTFICESHIQVSMVFSMYIWNILGLRQHEHYLMMILRELYFVSLSASRHP